MKRCIDSAIIHVVGSNEGPDEHSIPVERLIEMLQGLEDVVSGLADKQRLDPSDSRQRAQLSDDAKRHYRLFAQPSEVGSFQQAVDLYDTRDSNENVDPLFAGYETTFSDVIEVVSCVNKADRKQFDELVKSPSVAVKILSGIGKMCPKGTETVELKKSNAAEGVESVAMSAGVQSRIIEWKALCEGPFFKEIIAKVAAVDFDSRTMKLKLLGSGKKIKAPYSDELRDSAIKDVYEGTWKILCTVHMTPNGEILDIDQVDGLERLCLRDAITIDCFDSDGETIRFEKPLVISETLDQESSQAFIAEIPDLDIIAYSEFQDDLLPILREELANKWEWIVKCSDEMLTARAISVKRKFISLVEGGDEH